MFAGNIEAGRGYDSHEKAPAANETKRNF